MGRGNAGIIHNSLEGHQEILLNILKKELGYEGWLMYWERHWVWNGVTKSKVRELTRLFWNKFNISDLSTLFFVFDLSHA